jgi:hypothetical protein
MGQFLLNYITASQEKPVEWLTNVGVNNFFLQSQVSASFSNSGKVENISS